MLREKETLNRLKPNNGLDFNRSEVAASPMAFPLSRMERTSVKVGNSVVTP